jgi:hypothetical protein
MDKRIKLECWNCERVYSLFKHLDVDEEPKLIVECPFCESEGVVNLAIYPRELVEIYKAGEGETQTVGYTLDLPDVLPTSPLEE